MHIECEVGCDNEVGPDAAVGVLANRDSVVRDINRPGRIAVQRIGLQPDTTQATCIHRHRVGNNVGIRVERENDSVLSEAAHHVALNQAAGGLRCQVKRGIDKLDSAFGVVLNDVVFDGRVVHRNISARIILTLDRAGCGTATVQDKPVNYDIVCCQFQGRARHPRNHALNRRIRSRSCQECGKAGRGIQAVFSTQQSEGFADLNHFGISPCRHVDCSADTGGVNRTLNSSEGIVADKIGAGSGRGWPSHLCRSNTITRVHIHSLGAGDGR